MLSEGRGILWRWALLIAALPGSTQCLAQVSLRGQPGAGQANHLSALFILHDAGETFALSAALRALAEEGLAVEALALGQPAEDVVSCRGQPSTCRPLPSKTLRDLGVQVAVLDGTAGREQRLPEADVQAVVEALRPRVVVTGMNYAMQLQLGLGLKRASGGTFVAYYDALRLLGSDSDVPAQLQGEFAERSDGIWIASKVLWPSKLALWGHNYRVVGQPTLEEWLALSRQTEVLREVRRRLLGEEALADGLPVALWFGGYGPGYEQALRSWCQVVRAASSWREPRGLRFAHAVHPGSNYGDLDRQIMKEEGVEHLVTVVPEGVPGSAAALACNLTASQGSTGGVQSVFAGKPALFLDPTRAFRNSLSLGVRLGLVADAHSAAAAAEALREAAEGGWSVDTRRLEAAGVPGNATSQIVFEVHKLLSSPMPL